MKIRLTTTCEIGGCSSLRTFDSSHYLCISQNQSFVSENMTAVTEDPSLSVLSILPTWRRKCDVLIVNVFYGSAVRRQSVLSDLGNILQLLKVRGLVVFNGGRHDNCNAQRMEMPHTLSTVISARRRIRRIGNGDCPKHVPILQCASYGSWCEYWNRYVRAGFFQNPQCQTGEYHSCIAHVQLHSLCVNPVLARHRSDAIRINSKPPKTWRYFSATRCKKGVCLFFKDATYELYLAGMFSENGLEFAKPKIVMPACWHARLTHNTAILNDNQQYILVGGRYRWRMRGGKYGRDRGVWMTRGRDWKFGRDKSAIRCKSNTSNWEDPTFLFNGTHPGCTEKRNAVRMPWVSPDNACEFDGRMSLAKFKDKYLLYVRANTGVRGMRFVQVAESMTEVSFGPFQLIQIDNYSPVQGEIYFFAVQTHPLHDNILLSVFPIVHAFCGCIAISFSTNGIRWSSPISLLQSNVFGDRTVDHPVAGLVRQGESINLYLHKNVQNIVADLEISSDVLFHMRRFEENTSVVRYQFSEKKLWELTVQALRSHHFR